MRRRLIEFMQGKRQIGVNFPAAAGGKLFSASGTIVEVGDDFIMMQDIYGNAMLVPIASIAFIEVKK